MPFLNATKYDAHPWFKDLSQYAVKDGYADAEDAIARFHGKSRRFAFRADNGAGVVKMLGKTLKLPEKMGRLIKTHEPLRWAYKVIRGCRISERGGRWFASVRVEISEDEYGWRCGQGVLGIDLGLKAFATIAYPDGRIEEIEAPQPLRRGLRRLAKANRRLSRRVKGSKGWHRAKILLAKAHRRLTDIRKDFLH